MPLYKYKCEDCQNIFEELVFGDMQPKCPQCGSGNIKRHFQGKCYFGMTGKGSSEAGSAHGGGCSCGGSCGSCSGCNH